MRVLALTNMYPPHAYGGYEMSCRDVLRRFRERGHEVLVLTSTVRKPGVESDGEEDRRERADGIRRDLELYWDDHVLLSPPIRRRVAIERHNRSVVEAALDEMQPDVVSVWNMGAMSLGVLGSVAARGIPIVAVIEDDWLVYGPLLDAWARIWRKRSTRWVAPVAAALTSLPTRLPDLGAVGAFCFISATTRGTAVDNTEWTFPRSGLTYLGIEHTEFPVERPDAPIPPRPWRGDLLYVGRLDQRKGIDTAVRAIARTPGTTLRVVGAGDDTVLHDLKALARDLGVADRVAFGASERHQLRSIYAGADLCVFPSVWPEPFGLVPLEAMACDTPVVATGTGGSGEYLRDGENCLLFPAGDDAALAAAVGRLAADAALRAHLVGGGRRMASALGTDGLTDLLEAWHAGAVAGFPDGLPPDRVLPD